MDASRVLRRHEPRELGRVLEALAGELETLVALLGRLGQVAVAVAMLPGRRELVARSEVGVLVPEVRDDETGHDLETRRSERQVDA